MLKNHIRFQVQFHPKNNLSSQNKYLLLPHEKSMDQHPDPTSTIHHLGILVYLNEKRNV